MKHSILLLAALASSTGVLLVPRMAFAGDAVLVPTSGGLGAEMPDIATRLTAALERVAKQNGQATKVTDASRDDVFAIAGCDADDDPCYQAVLRTLGADTLILAHVTPGAGTTTADVEIVVARRSKPPTKTVIALSALTTESLVAEFEAKAPPAFGGVATTTTPTTTNPTTTTPTTTPTSPTTGNDSDPEVPVENTTIDGGLGTGEGTPFSRPTGTESERPVSPFGPESPGPKFASEETPPNAGLVGPQSERGGGYDFSRVSNTSWAIGGAGVGLVLTSFVFYNLAGNKQDEVNAARANTAADIARIRELESSGKTRNNIGNTAFVLGLVGLGVGGYLIYRDAKVPLIPEVAEGVAISPQLLGDGGFGVGIMVTR